MAQISSEDMVSVGRPDNIRQHKSVSFVTGSGTGDSLAIDESSTSVSGGGPDNIDISGEFMGAVTGTNPSACTATGVDACSDPHDVKKIIEFNAQSMSTVDPGVDNPELPVGNTEAATAVRIAATALKCRDESCVRREISTINTERDHMKFDPRGPRNNTELIYSTDIDIIMRRWGDEHPTFMSCKFAMMDFATNGNELGSTDYTRAFQSGQFTKFGCVLNTDLSYNPGKHWVALFIDYSPASTTVEYFDSVGNPPSREVCAWLRQTQADIQKIPGTTNINIKIVTTINHQRFNTECGVYALFYIRSRLMGTAISFFESDRISDDEIKVFRTHLFRR